MAQIPGVIFVVIGGIMAWYSKYVESKTENTMMTIFFWVGVAFVAVGVLKIIFDYNSKMPKPVKKKNQEHRPQQAQMHAQHQHYAQQHYPQQHQRQVHPQPVHNQHQAAQRYHIQTAQQPAHLTIIGCPRCGTRHYSHANFCQQCGTRLK